MTEHVKLIDPATGLAYRAGGNADASGNATVSVVPSTGPETAAESGELTEAAASLILKASAANLYGYECCAGGEAGYLMVFDAATVPADGDVTPKRVHAIDAGASFARSFNPPIRMGSGIVLAFSTTGPFTKTESATAFLAGEYA